MSAPSLWRRNFMSSTDGIEPLLSAGIIQMGPRGSTDTDSSNHFSAEFNGKSAT